MADEPNAGAEAIAAAEAANAELKTASKPNGKAASADHGSEIQSPAETLATMQGWTPKEDWVKQGKDPEKWRDAKGFLEYGAKNSALLNERLEKMTRRVEELTTRAERGEQAAADLALLKAKAEERGYDRAKKEIMARHAAAVETGDGTAAAQAMEELTELKKPEPEKPPERQQPQGDTPEFTQWKKENNWFDNDKEMRRYADRQAKALALEYAQTRTRVSQEDFLAEVLSEVKGRFPDKFRPNGSAPPPPDGGGHGSTQTNGSRKGKSYDDLPSDAKAACDRIIATKHKGKPIMTQAQYVKDYFGQD